MTDVPGLWGWVFLGAGLEGFPEGATLRLRPGWVARGLLQVSKQGRAFQAKGLAQVGPGWDRWPSPAASAHCDWQSPSCVLKSSRERSSEEAEVRPREASVFLSSGVTCTQHVNTAFYSWWGWFQLNFKTNFILSIISKDCMMDFIL